MATIHDTPTAGEIVPNQPIRADDAGAMFKRVRMKLRHRAGQLRSTHAPHSEVRTLWKLSATAKRL
jgi:hypothetical protein